MTRLLVALLLFLPVMANAQQIRTLPPGCTAANLITDCVPQVEGTRARVIDAASTSVCTGGGSTTVVCEYNGTTWELSPALAGNVLTGGNDETISIGVVDSTFTFTTDGTETATITGADAAGASTTIYDTSGAGFLQVGSADVQIVNVVTDGGTVAIDGSVKAQVPAAAVASGAIAINSITLATAAADYDIPDGACDAAADVGNWVTIVVEDDTTLVSITSDDASNAFFVPGLDITAGNELDNVITAAHEGQNITLTCLAADQWYMTAGSLNLAGAATIAWADGGGAD